VCQRKRLSVLDTLRTVERLRCERRRTVARACSTHSTDQHKKQHRRLPPRQVGPSSFGARVRGVDLKTPGASAEISWAELSTARKPTGVDFKTPRASAETSWAELSAARKPAGVLPRRRRSEHAAPKFRPYKDLVVISVVTCV